MANPKRQHKSINPIESLEDIGSGVKSTVVNDVLKAGAKDFFSQLLPDIYGSSRSRSTELHQQENEPNSVEIFSSSTKNSHEMKVRKSPEIKKKPEAKGAIDYHNDILKVGKEASSREVQKVDNQIREIMVEIKKLVTSSKALQMEFAEVAIEKTNPNVGEYHINFFEWILSAIKIARKRVDESGAWLNTMKSKNGKKGYWGMFKKHGTSFGMSGERNVATQTG